jgi:pimeloyl-ACP methyl ester carboxylesterase
MPELDVEGVPINYIVEGDGPEIVLVHGFASNLHGNWRATGVVAALVESGRRVIALDCRGHGRSGKPYDPAQYGMRRMADDVIALMDHLGVQRADLAGYSMGGFISSRLLVTYPDRWRSVILGGVGDVILEGARSVEVAESIARAMTAEDGGKSETEFARGFRLFAERSGNDLQALAAMQRGPRDAFDASKLRELAMPVMVLVGNADTIIRSADRLAATIPGVRYVKLDGDHLTVLGNPGFKQAMVDFLAEHSPVPAIS